MLCPRKRILDGDFLDQLDERFARRAFAYRNNSEDDEYEDESEEESEGENSEEDTHRIKTKRKKLNIDEYYTGNALKNILHMILGVA